MAKKVVYRSSESGQFITKEKAGKNPAKTEREVVRVPAPKKK
jgi:hypothetical protein